MTAVLPIVVAAVAMTALMAHTLRADMTAARAAGRTVRPWRRTERGAARASTNGRPTP